MTVAKDTRSVLKAPQWGVTLIMDMCRVLRNTRHVVPWATLRSIHTKAGALFWRPLRTLALVHTRRTTASTMLEEGWVLRGKTILGGLTNRITDSQDRVPTRG